MFQELYQEQTSKVNDFIVFQVSHGYDWTAWAPSGSNLCILVMNFVWILFSCPNKLANMLSPFEPEMGDIWMILWSLI
jgi:hypothetical protein